MNYDNIRALVVGLGSMGKRRIRCLQALGVKSIHGFDQRADRGAEAAAKYGVPTHIDFESALAAAQPTVLIISVPPHVHHTYMKAALAARIPFFVEASVVDTDMVSIIEQAERAGVFGAPSATMVFHGGVRLIKETLASGSLGKLSNITEESFG